MQSVLKTACAYGQFTIVATNTDSGAKWYRLVEICYHNDNSGHDGQSQKVRAHLLPQAKNTTAISTTKYCMTVLC